MKDINKLIIGIYRLSMKTNTDNYRESSILNIIKEKKKKDVHILIYEPLILDSSLDDVKDKVYTRDLLRRE